MTERWLQSAKSPFKINRELVKILGAEPHGVTKQRSGDLMVELHSKEQERKLERESSFLDIPVTVVNLLKEFMPSEDQKHPLPLFLQSASDIFGPCGHYKGLRNQWEGFCMRTEKFITEL